MAWFLTGNIMQSIKLFPTTVLSKVTFKGWLVLFSLVTAAYSLNNMQNENNLAISRYVEEQKRMIEDYNRSASDMISREQSRKAQWEQACKTLSEGRGYNVCLKK
jgi:hypothetical protein